MMRIITGSARGTKLLAPTGEHTRPTSERAKEALFSMLGEEVRGRHVLDLFAGSGQLGLEALSRGAVNAVFTECDAAAVSVIKKNIERTHFEEKATVIPVDALHFSQRKGSAPFNLIFLDPPYAAGLMPICLSNLLSSHLLLADAIVVCETANAEDVFGKNDMRMLSSFFQVKRTQKYGAAVITLLTLHQEDFQ